MAPVQQKRGVKDESVPQTVEEACDTVVLLRLGLPQVVETPQSCPHNTVGRRALGTDTLYVESEKMAYNVLLNNGKWPKGRFKTVDVPVPRPVKPVIVKD